MSNWYLYMRKQTDFILEAIKKQPFIKQLIEGTLPGEIFQFYIRQDALYLAEYKRILATIGVKCKDPDHAQFFLDAATGIISVENALHQSFLHHPSVPVEPSPTCELYTSYLVKAVCNGSLEEGLAAVLPCFTIYNEIGNYILLAQDPQKDNPYQEWINTYGGEAFAESVNQAIDITNQHAENATDSTLNDMNAAFIKSSKMEWMFWDSAYHQEKWKV